MMMLQASYGPTRLEGADLREAKNLTQEQIDRTCVDEDTLLPTGLSAPRPCVLEEFETRRACIQ
jgi:hypothetical protein